ncbi:hypothetical protein ABE484_17420 [Pseudomonas pudica]|uniref:hypothetical protein n=1 Tax=Pseudomonas TaxID=286 RepID=UPI000A1D963E|nr:hypothetical protein [Pseudomonas sp. B10(2017)]
MIGFDKGYALSEMVRREYRRLIAAWQTRRSPEFHSSLQDLIIDDDMLADKDRGLVYSKYLKDEDFVLKVPGWIFSDRDTLRIEHSRDNKVWTVLHEEVVEYFSKPIDLPYPVSLDKSKDQMGLEGTHYFRTWIKNDAEDFSYSDSLELIFDRIPPYDHAPPAKFPGIPVVTDASLATAGGKVTLALPNYTDFEPGDCVIVYWMNHIPEDFEDVDLPVAKVPIAGANQLVDIPEAAVRAVGDGGVFVLYVLVDRAGNVSEMSIYTSVAVALGTLPAVFDDPIVPLATDLDDYLIDQADAALGIEVWVPLYEGQKATDFVVITWGKTELPPETVGSAPGDYIRVLVPADVLLKEYGSGPGEVPTKVSYTLLRGTHPLGGAETDIKVNFETLDPGGPDPSWPLPIHPGLKKPVITGQGSEKVNELDTDDTDLDAYLNFELYSFAIENDELTFYWGGDPAVTYTVKDTDKPGADIRVEVPWDNILKVGNAPAVPVDYEARRAGVHNPVRSGITTVKVEAIIIEPEAATFDHLNGGLVNCASIKATASHTEGPAVEVLIPDLSEYLKYGAFSEVRVRWWVYRGRSDEQGFEIIDEVTLEEDISLDDYPITGFTYRIPFDTHVLPTYDGSSDVNFIRSRANFTYTILRDDGDFLSAEAKVTLAFVTPAGTCDPYGRVDP